MAPKTLLMMVREWQDAEKYKAQVLAYVINGGRLESDYEEPEEIEVHPDCF